MGKRVRDGLKNRWQIIGAYSISQLMVRLLAALAIVLLYQALSIETAFTDKAFYDSIDFWTFLLWVIGLFWVGCFVNNDRFFTLLLLMSVTWYFLLSAESVRSYPFSFGLCAVIFVLVFFVNTEELTMPVGAPVLWGAVGVLAVLSVVFVGGVCCLYYRNYGTPNFDFGIFAHMFHHMKESGEMLTTCERDGLLSHFAVHTSPIYYLLLPVYRLFPDPTTLLIAQAVVVASGVVPLMLLCKRLKLSNGAALLFGLCYILYPSFMGGSFYYLHENCFLAPLLLWVLYCAEAERGLWALGFAGLTLLVKEDAPVYVAVVALYLLFAGKLRRWNVAIFGLAVVYFLVVTHWMGVSGEGIMADSRYGPYLYDDGGIFTVIKSVLQNPVFAIQQIFRQEKWLFLLQMLVPLCGLPLVVRKPAKLILFIPLLLVNLMTNYPYQYDIGFQYTFGSGALLFYLAVSNYAEMGSRRHKLLLCAVLSSMVVFAGGWYSKTDYYEKYRQDTAKRETISWALMLVPEDASVAASTFLVANLANREVIYELETTKHIDDVQYIVVDMRGSAGKTLAETYRTEAYETVTYEADAVAVFRRVTE